MRRNAPLRSVAGSGWCEALLRHAIPASCAFPWLSLCLEALASTSSKAGCDCWRWPNRALLRRPLEASLPGKLPKITSSHCILAPVAKVTVVDSKEFFEFTPSILRALADPPHLSRTCRLSFGCVKPSLPRHASGHVAPARITFDYREAPSPSRALRLRLHSAICNLCEVLEGQLGVEFVLGQAVARRFRCAPRKFHPKRRRKSTRPRGLPAQAWLVVAGVEECGGSYHYSGRLSHTASERSGGSASGSGTIATNGFSLSWRLQRVPVNAEF